MSGKRCSCSRCHLLALTLRGACSRSLDSRHLRVRQPVEPRHAHVDLLLQLTYSLGCIEGEWIAMLFELDQNVIYQSR